MNKNNSGYTKTQSKEIKNPKSLPSILSMGELCLDYELQLKEEEMVKLLLSIESITSITQLHFLKDIKGLYKRIQIRAKTSTLSTLLYLNKTRKTKLPIEFIAFMAPHYSEEEQFLSDIMKKTLNLHGIHINHSNILPSLTKMELTFSVRYGSSFKTFSIGKRSPPIKTDSTGKNLLLLQPVIQNDNSPLCNISLLKQQYAYFFIDYFELLAIEGSFKGEDFVDFIFWLKKSCQTTIIIFYPNISHLFNTKENIVQLFHLWYLTDIFIQTRENSNKNFSTFNKFYGSKGGDQNDIAGYDVWEKKIAVNGFKLLKSNTASSKVNLIINEYSSIELTEMTPESNVSQWRYDFKPFPKMNHLNVALIDRYKAKLTEEKPFFLSVFIGGMLGRVCKSTGKVKGLEVLYPAYLAGMSILKRVIDSVIITSALPVANSFYLVRLDKEKIAAYIDQSFNEKKEKRFVLDCVNETQAQMKYYVPLIDENISSFLTFGKRKELKAKGFINKNDYLVYDPIYRSVLGSSFLYDQRHEVTAKSINNELSQHKDTTSSNTIRSSSVTDLKLPSITKRHYYIRTTKHINGAKSRKNLPTSPDNRK